MRYQHIQFETRDGVSMLMLDRPAVMNALNRAAVDEICDAFDRIRDEGASRCWENGSMLLEQSSGV